MSNRLGLEKLTIFWSKREADFLIRYPRSCDGHLLYWHMCAERQRYDYITRGVVFDLSFVAELEARGYDTKTLRFSVQRKRSTATRDARPAANGDKSKQ